MVVKARFSHRVAVVRVAQVQLSLCRGRAAALAGVVARSKQFPAADLEFLGTITTNKTFV